MKHKHAELIKAWADGAEIERKELYCRYQMNEAPSIVSEEWIRDPSPSWGWMTEYRIKPEPKPDIKEFLYLNKDGVWHTSASLWKGFYDTLNPLIAITWDGETGKLKLAEVLK